MVILVYDRTMQIYLGADHRGVALKDTLKSHLVEQGHTVKDLGAAAVDPADDYPKYAIAVAQAVAQNQTSKGIVVCGSGVGMAIAANKVAGIRAASVTSQSLAKQSRVDDDTNVLSLGADFVTSDDAISIVDTWLTTPFSGEARHRRRLDQIAQLEGT